MPKLVTKHILSSSVSTLQERNRPLAKAERFHGSGLGRKTPWGGGSEEPSSRDTKQKTAGAISATLNFESMA